MLSIYKSISFHSILGSSKTHGAYFTHSTLSRLAKLNKTQQKLPFPLHLTDGSVRPLSVLEAVLKQTAIYARKGRLSVFWGDQVFLPSASSDVTPTHHIDILCSLLGDTAPTAEEWQEQGLDKYGVIAVMSQENGKQEAAQVEKVSHETATAMLAGLGGKLQQVGPSLGSFSVSAAILEALLKEFAPELEAKTAKLDTDPHFWMPLTLDLSAYKKLMSQKSTSEEESTAHYERIAKMKAAFLETSANGDGLGLFGAVNVGKDACWWDYGQLQLYCKNTLLLLEPDTNPSAKLLRQFLGLETDRVVESTATETSLDDKSYVICSQLGSDSKVTSSLIANVACPAVEADGAIIVNCAAPSIKAGKGAILYNLLSEDEPIVADAGVVQVGLSSGKVLKSRIDIDGGKAWKEILPENEMSFEQVHGANKGADIGALAKERAEKYNALVQKLGLKRQKKE